MDLSAAAFKKDDAGLVPTAGPCTLCPKRSGFEPALFEDIGADDRCTDPGCYHAKLDALVVRRRVELAGQEYFEVAGAWDGHPPAKAKGDFRPLGEWEWKECRKKDEGAKRVLTVTGVGRGALTWGRVANPVTGEDDGDAKGGSQRPDYAAKERQRQEEFARIRVEREGIYRSVLAAAAGREMEILPVIALAMFQPAYVALDRLCELEGWVQDVDESGEASPELTIEKMLLGATPDQTILMMLRLAVAPDVVNVTFWGDGNQNVLYAAADALGVPHPEPAPQPDLGDEYEGDGEDEQDQDQIVDPEDEGDQEAEA
jgi:hypothetical protein